MPFFLDGSPTDSEVSEAVNYLLSNFSNNVSANQVTGQIVGPSGEITGYLYKYIAVKYADSFDGSVNFSNTPTNRLYYGLRNTDSSVESTNPSDYVWYAVTGGFGVSKFLYYITTGGRTIQFAVATSIPNNGWIVDSGASINLDFTTASSSVANFVVIRVPNNSAAPTDSECISAIGRTPIAGDICTVNYNSGIYSIVYKYTTGWAVFQKYITGDIIVANTITASNIASGTVWTNYLQVGASPVVSGTTMTGSGATINADGTFALGNPTTNISFNGGQMTLNGNVVATNNIVNNAVSTYTTHLFGNIGLGGGTTASWSPTPSLKDGIFYVSFRALANSGTIRHIDVQLNMTASTVGNITLLSSYQSAESSVVSSYFTLPFPYTSTITDTYSSSVTITPNNPNVFILGVSVAVINFMK